jgi:hypothetical protein
MLQFIALQLSRQPKEIEIYIRKNSMDDCFATNNTSTDETRPDHYPRLERLWEEKSLSELYPSLATGQGDLVFSISKWLFTPVYFTAASFLMPPHCFLSTSGIALLSERPRLDQICSTSSLLQYQLGQSPQIMVFNDLHPVKACIYIIQYRKVRKIVFINYHLFYLLWYLVRYTLLVSKKMYRVE